MLKCSIISFFKEVRNRRRIARKSEYKNEEEEERE